MKIGFPSLFQPISIGGLVLKNRLIVSPIGTCFCRQDGHIDERMSAYLKQRAKGGFGLIIAEGIAVDPCGRGHSFHPGIWDDSFIPEYRRIVDGIHENGAKIAVQLMHAGRSARPEAIYGQQSVAPSAVPDPLIRHIPKELSKMEITSISNSFAQAAIRAKKSGFDAIELHGGHGYLISQFMSGYANKRGDEYGGGPGGFIRFPVEIVRKIKEVIGPEVPLIFRISSEEGVKNGRSLDESIEMSKRLVDEGVDAIHVSMGVYETSYLTMAPPYMEQGYNVKGAAAIKSAVSVPVIAVGRIHDPDLAEEIISSGKADMIAIGRQSLADPQWPLKIAQNRTEEIVKCLSCLECLASTWHGNPIVCVQNPVLGRECENKSPVSIKIRKILIAGGGPAGLEAARTAAIVGHEVILYEKNASLGGQVPIAATPPKKELLKEVILSRVKEIEKLGVKIKTGVAVNAEIVKEIHPDVLIVATGSIPCTPNIPGIKSKNVISAADVLSGSLVGENVVIIGGGIIGCETADFLAQQGKKVTIVEMLKRIAQDLLPSQRYFLVNRMAENKVRILTSTKVIAINGNDITVRSEKGEQKIGPIDNIVLAAGAVSENNLASELRDIVPEIFIIGDALNPGKILQAIQQAVKIVRSL